MKLALLFASLAFAGASLAGPIDEGYAQKLAEAIWHAEGGHKAKVSHGVLSVRTRSPEHAREVCLRTIRNTWGRWEAAGRPGDFIEHLGERYCPTKGPLTPNERKLNPNWVKNVRFFLRKQFPNGPAPD